MTTPPKPADEPSDAELQRIYDGPAADWDEDSGLGAPTGSFQLLHVWRAGRASRGGEVAELRRQLDAEILQSAEYGTMADSAEAELARLRAALESAQSDRQRAVDDLFAQLRENERLRAESMRGAVEKLRGKAMVFREAAHYGDAGRRPELIRDAEVAEECADWLEQQSATPQPDY